MLLKDEEIKKAYSRQQSLKSTIGDLQEGIQTYQSMAEQKERQVEEEREKQVMLEQEIIRLQNEVERVTRKLKDSRLEAKTEQILEEKEDSPHSRKE